MIMPPARSIARSAMSAPFVVTPALITSAEHLVAAKYYALCSFVMLTYDISLTLSLEIEKIWKKQISGLSVLWFLNRWVFFAAVIPTIASFQSPSFVGTLRALLPIPRLHRHVPARRHWVSPLSYGVKRFSFLLDSSAVSFLLRQKMRKNLSFTGYLNCAQVRKLLSDELALDVLIHLDQIDAVVLSLTIYRSYAAFKTFGGFSHTQIWRVIVKDGIIYFLVMFGANLTTVLMYIIAAQDLKASNADFGVMINSIMTARLILNLKAAASTQNESEHHYTGFGGAQAAWEANLLGNIGNEFEGSTADNSVHSELRYPKGRSTIDTFDFSDDLELPPAGGLLFFWPMVWGLAMAAYSKKLPFNELATLLLKTVFGAFIMRSSACTVNDIFDRKFDAAVERTKNRPVASGQVSVFSATLFLFFQFFIGALFFSTYNSLVFWISLIEMIPLLSIYPLIKRFSYWPQAWLGISVNLGFAQSWFQIDASISHSFDVIGLMIAGTWCWTMMYDTVYGCQDRRDDIKVGIWSSSLFFGDHVWTAAACFDVGFVIFLYYAGVANGHGFPYFAICNQPQAVGLFGSQSTENFKNNAFYLGPLIFSGIMADYVRVVV
ncbi:hypothetical protein EW145_g3107 [Phellinidium pouzarii]|uniref:DUF6533 domain-containing protein n=1 Tax=Phellinidium pouzarii TaxID=167371 RepID=A0A4S4LAB4_9AGAM|nr:hypothetical protein EW145_g3107 [Phellinidium pouzarii]